MLPCLSKTAPLEYSLSPTKLPLAVGRPRTVHCTPAHDCALGCGRLAVFRAIAVDGGDCGGVPAGNARAAATVAFTLICAAISCWVIVAGIVGPAFGLLPWESALRLGPALFTAIASNWLDAAAGFWLCAALGLALWWNR